MIVCTSICANYLPKAAVLAQSLKKYNPSYKMVVCLLEDKVDSTIKEYQSYFDTIILAKNLGFKDFNNFIFKYDIVEASTAVKGQLFKYLLESYPDEEKFMYLDPDIEVYNSFIQLEKILVNHSIVLTPHMCNQELNDDLHAIVDNEVNSSLKYGVFNLGFLAIRRSLESEKFIDWWTSRLNIFCYDDMFDRGIFTDQRWMDLAPCLFDIFILKDLGYNVAPWNVSKRKITSDLKVNNKFPLVFFHFSGFDSGANELMINRYVPDKEDYIYTIRNKYIREINHFNFNSISERNWSYGYFFSGEKIEKETRRLYRDKIDMFNELLESPFRESNDSIKNFYPKSLLGKKVYIWGTGTAGLKTYSFYKSKGIGINGWIDSNKELQGNYKEDLKILNPEDFLLSFEKDEKFILIGTSYYKEVIPTLEKKGLKQNLNYIISQTLF